MESLGIDIGGSGIKGAVVNVASGELLSERVRLTTPQPATPQAVAKTVSVLVRQLDWRGPVGCGFPAIISNGVARSAANIDVSWVDVDVEVLLAEATGCSCTVVNDADAAGLAEMRFGCGKGRTGTVLVLTLGTGIGSALFYNELLYPNSELGHLSVKGMIAEHYASAAVRKNEGLSWKAWAKRLNRVFAQAERVLSPELIVIGGGVSRKHEKFFPYLETLAELQPAALRNQAGIIGAACRAKELNT